MARRSDRLVLLRTLLPLALGALLVLLAELPGAHAAVANDVCGAAQVLAPNVAGSQFVHFVNGSTVGATTEASGSSCATSYFNDVWYAANSFSVPFLHT